MDRSRPPKPKVPAGLSTTGIRRRPLGSRPFIYQLGNSYDAVVLCMTILTWAYTPTLRALIASYANVTQTSNLSPSLLLVG